MTSRVFSATGKAILAGGYLVLFPQYKAFVVALSARMHALVQCVTETTEKGTFRISVDSPQFENGSWSYAVNIRDLVKDQLHHQLVEKDGKRNPFVEATVLTVLSYAIGANVLSPESSGKNINITMFSDAEYHSQDNSVAKSSTNGAYKFLYHEAEITKVNKTGLGSSAGLVTSLTAALLASIFDTFDIKNVELKWKEKVHNLAQVAHCKAQGKIGSGFDVASATFGSIIYQRFEAKLINNILDSTDDTFNKLVTLVDQQDWNMTHEQCSLPPGIRLLMGDVKGGSETPKMVSKVLEWKNSNPERAAEVWTKLNASNMKLIDALQSLEALSKANKDEYNHLLSLIATKSSTEVREARDMAQFKDVVNSIADIRNCLQIMTSETGASIEPQSQTQLIDAVASIKGVLGGVVPGAGGYDAICMLVASAKVDDIVATTREDTQRYSNVRWMDLTEQRDGLIEESPADFNGLLH